MDSQVEVDITSSIKSKFENRTQPEKQEKRLIDAPLDRPIPLKGQNSKRIQLYDIGENEAAVVKFSRYSNIQCECAAFIVSDVMGFDVVPSVVLREKEGGQVSLQEFIPEGKAIHEVDISQFQDDLYGIWLFDHIIRNGDRWEGNLLFFNNSRVKALDHESAFFSIDTGHDLYDTYYGEECPPKIRKIFDNLLSDPTIETKLRADLSGLLPTRDIDETIHRAMVIGQLIVTDSKIDSPDQLNAGFQEVLR